MNWSGGTCDCIRCELCSGGVGKVGYSFGADVDPAQVDGAKFGRARREGRIVGCDVHNVLVALSFGCCGGYIMDTECEFR